MAVKLLLLAAAMTPLAMALTLKATEESMSIKTSETGDMQVGTASDGIYIALKSHWGKYVVAEKNGDLNANRDRVGEWERFEMITHKGGGKWTIISLKSIHGNYIVAEENGQCHANKDMIGNAMKFKMITHRDGSISLKSKKFGKYVVAEKNGHLNANRGEAKSWEKFTVMYLAKPPSQIVKPKESMRVALKTSHGQFWTAGKDGKMNAYGQSIGSSEEFTMYKHKDGRVSFKSAHGKYMVAEKDGKVFANRHWMRAWEKFEITPGFDCALSCTISLKSAHSKYVVAERDGRLNADRNAGSTWEKFELMNLDGIAAKKIADAKAAKLKAIADAKAAEAAKLKAIADAKAAELAKAAKAAAAEAARIAAEKAREAAAQAEKLAKAKELAEKIRKEQARQQAIADAKAAKLKAIADAQRAKERKICKQCEAFKNRDAKYLGNRRGVCHAGIFQPAGWFATAQDGQNVFTAACLGTPNPHGQQLCSSVGAELFSHFNAQGRKGMKVPFTTKTVPDSSQFCKSLYRLLQAHEEWLAGRSKKAMKDRSKSLPRPIKKLDHTTQGKAVDKKQIHALLQSTESEEAVDADLIEDVPEDSETIVRADDLEEVEEGSTDEQVEDVEATEE